MQNEAPVTEPNSDLKQQYAPQIAATVERLAKGFNVEANVRFASSPAEASRLVDETMALLMAKYPSATDLAAKAAEAAAQVIKIVEGK